MEKKFDDWNKLKKEIDKKSDLDFSPRVGEIWYLNIGINVGNESLGKGDKFKRAVLIVKRLGNMYFCFSMTTQGKDNNIFYIRISDEYFDKKSYIIKSQLKSFDKRRFIKRIGQLSNKDFYNIKKELRKFVF